MNEEELMQGKRSNIDLWCGRGEEEGEGLGKVGGGGGEGGEGGGGSGDCRAGRRFSQLGLPAILASRLFRRLQPASNRPREGNRPFHICTPLCLDFTAMSNDYDKLGGSSGKVRHK